jgi:hypothetical protein
MEGRMRGRKPPLPGPLLHKYVEERENTPELSLHEPAVWFNTAWLKSVVEKTGFGRAGLSISAA